MSDTLARLADSNLVTSVRVHARWQQPLEYLEQDGVLLMAGANEFPIANRNCAIRTDAAVPPQVVLERAREFFLPRQRGFTVMTRKALDADLESTLEQAGLRMRRTTPCMLIDKPLAAPQFQSDVTIESFTSIKQVQDAIAINREAYLELGLPAEETNLYFSRPEALLSDDVLGFVLYRGGRPCSTALTIINGRAAGLYWVGSAAHTRRAGLAEACVRLATNAGFAHGADVVTLQASPFGAPLYERLGYRTYDHLDFFLQPAPQQQAGAA